MKINSLLFSVFDLIFWWCDNRYLGGVNDKPDSWKPNSWSFVGMTNMSPGGTKADNVPQKQCQKNSGSFHQHYSIWLINPSPPAETSIICSRLGPVVQLRDTQPSWCTSHLSHKSGLVPRSGFSGSCFILYKYLPQKVGCNQEQGCLHSHKGKTIHINHFCVYGDKASGVGAECIQYIIEIWAGFLENLSWLETGSRNVIGLFVHVCMRVFQDLEKFFPPPPPRSWEPNPGPYAG